MDPRPTFLGLAITPINRRRLDNFNTNRRGYWSLWIFLFIFFATLFAEFIANDKPLLVRYGGDFYIPVLVNYAETTFGGDFETEAEYSDPEVAELIQEKGWIVWPLIPYSFDTVVLGLPVPSPSPPTALNWLDFSEGFQAMLQNWLGTDDQGRDVVARLIYGFRVSVLFGLILTIFSSVVGVAAGAWQGYFGGIIDLLFQRFMEVWGGLPQLFILIIQW